MTFQGRRIGLGFSISLGFSIIVVIGFVSQMQAISLEGSATCSYIDLGNTHVIEVTEVES